MLRNFNALSTQKLRCIFTGEGGCNFLIERICSLSTCFNELRVWPRLPDRINLCDDWWSNSCSFPNYSNAIVFEGRLLTIIASESLFPCYIIIAGSLAIYLHKKIFIFQNKSGLGIKFENGKWKIIFFIFYTFFLLIKYTIEDKNIYKYNRQYRHLYNWQYRCWLKTFDYIKRYKANLVM